MQKLIFFDLDGTLLPGNSWADFNHYFGMSPIEDGVLLDWYGRGIITYEEWDSLIVRILKEQNRCTEKGLPVFLETLSPREEAQQVIQACKERGYTTIILSGTMKQIAEHMGAKLGVDLVRTTAEIIYDKEGNLDTVKNDSDEGPAKLRIFESVCAEYGVDSKEVIHVGDSRNDLEIFSHTKCGVLLGDHATLKPVAWKQIQKLDEVLELL